MSRCANGTAHIPPVDRIILPRYPCRRAICGSLKIAAKCVQGRIRGGELRQGDCEECARPQTHPLSLTGEFVQIAEITFSG